jgi:hypothetical protein
VAARLSLPATAISTEPASGRVSLMAGSAAADDLLEAAAALRHERIGIADIGLHQPSLDETFLALTATTGTSVATATSAGTGASA